MIKVIVVDWGNVLCSRDMETFWKNMAESLGIHGITFKEIEIKNRILNDVGKITFKERAKNIVQELGVKILTKKYLELEESLSPTRMNNFLVNILKNLKGKYKIFLFSNNNERFYDKLMANNEMSSLFNKVLVSNKYNLRKPDPLFFEKIIEGTDYSFSDCLLIDDRKDITESAKKLGMKIITYKNDINIVMELKENGVDIT